MSQSDDLDFTHKHFELAQKHIRLILKVGALSIDDVMELIQISVVQRCMHVERKNITQTAKLLGIARNTLSMRILEWRKKGHQFVNPFMSKDDIEKMC